MKNKGFEGFGSVDAISVFGLMGIVLAIICSILFQNTQNKIEQSAKNKMAILSAQIVTGGLKSRFANAALTGRTPASALDQIDLKEIGGEEGKIGEDPWGQSYHYKVVNSENVGFIVLISGGPNGSIQTDYTKIITGPNGHLLNAKFSLDDIGYIKKIQ